MAKKRTQPTRRKARRKANWKELFLLSLAQCGVVRYACVAACVNRSAAYEERGKDSEFARRWDEAIEDAADIWEAEAIRRAVKGVRKPVFYKGAIVGHIQEYSDGLLTLILKAHKAKYRKDAADDVGPNDDVKAIREFLDAPDPPASS